VTGGALMTAAVLDPVTCLRRRQQRAGAALTILSAFHYLLAAPAFLIFGMWFFAAAAKMVQRMGNWGVVSPWDLQGLLFAIAGLAYGVGTVYSGRLIDRRTGRRFSLAWAAAHLFTVVGVPLALLTWAALFLPSVRELYDGSALPFEPRMRPPPLPLPVLPVAQEELAQDSPVAGG
jgi:MFS family permease